MGLGKEPEIIVNGIALTVGQAMTVALETFAISLMGDSDMGDIGRAYMARINEIRPMMMSEGRES